MQLQEKFDQLEDLLLNHRESIGIHNGVPFIMLIYRVSNLLNSLEKETKNPFVIFYPGEVKEDGKLYFMGELESNEYYRAQRI